MLLSAARRASSAACSLAGRRMGSGLRLANANATNRVVAVMRQITGEKGTVGSNAMMSTSTTTTQPPSQPQAANLTKVEVRHQKMQSVRVFLLNRPKAFNALNLSMVQNIVPQLQVWEESNLCKVIVITNSDDSKAFCAGGDVKTIVQQASSGKPEDIAKSLKFFEEEYKLNHLIGTLRKPFISIMNGITMGGGVGLSVHAPFRVATEKTLFAMPETAIGLFPDVGGSFFLPRLDGELGTYLGLTGDKLKGEEVFMAGIATHYIPSERLPSLMARLAELETDELEVINMVLEEFVGDSEMDKWRNWSMGGEVASAIDRCFQFDTIEEICAALEKEGTQWSKKTLETLKAQSPTSLKVTLAQLRHGRKKHFMECFEMEYNMCREFLTKTPDFYEGVTAKLIDKPPRAPEWKPSWENMASLTPSVIKTYFEPLKDVKDTPKHSQGPAPRLSFLNTLTYWDYPHRSMSGLPTMQDIKRVVHGKGRRNTHVEPPQTKEEVVSWFEQHWGGYDASVVGTTQYGLLKHQNISIEGGFGRGKTGLREKILTTLDRYIDETSSASGRLKWKTQ
ncbi:hypothetical protein PhCBS80983_g04687 [Powellomyces hirtus]|uniref:3-hydroxyisobutyryl-CoA hydrolase n=1 Tax=Powellomyces hirtus TaxID=109895 RepID=A0A507DXN1_9FUNG|nr:hypothetical protein PhCBS80983_g04687 [Powellomyces hirtus]